MRKTFYIFVALVALVSCNKPTVDEPGVTPNYGFKASDAAILRTVFSADTTDTFYAENDYAVMEGTTQIPAGVSYEIIRLKNGTVVTTDEETGKTYASAAVGGSVDATIHNTYKISGMNMEVHANLQNSSEPFEPLDICGEYGEALTTIYVCSNYWSIGDTRDCNWLKSRDYCVTNDLNKDCGVRSDYSRLAFGGKYHKNYYDASPYIAEISREDWHPETYGWKAYPPELEKSVITGLRLVSGGGENPPSKIVDAKTGITWTKCPVYFITQENFTSSGFSDEYLTGAGDLNNGAKGDYLYLYITREYTGRKIMLVNPYLAQYEKNCGKSTSTQHNGEDAIIPRNLFSTMLTWYSPNWKCYPDSIFEELAVRVDKSPAQDLSKYIRKGDLQRVDFIRCYDTSMNPKDADNDKDGLPDVCANFNRNAKGDVEIFISYSFITEADSYWSRF